LEVVVGYVVLPGLEEGDAAHFTELFVVPVAESVQKNVGQAPCFTAVEEFFHRGKCCGRLTWFEVYLEVRASSLSSLGRGMLVG